MTLTEAIKKVREENLDKDQLEKYHLLLSGLLYDMKQEVASLEKAEAIFMAKDFGKDLSVADRKVFWKSTPQGQRLIEMKANVSSTNTMVGSIKTRLYSVY